MGLSVPIAGAFTLNYVLRVGNNEVFIRAPSGVLFTADYAIAVIAGVIALMVKTIHSKALGTVNQVLHLLLQLRSGSSCVSGLLPLLTLLCS